MITLFRRLSSEIDDLPMWIKVPLAILLCAICAMIGIIVILLFCLFSPNDVLAAPSQASITIMSYGINGTDSGGLQAGNTYNVIMNSSENSGNYINVIIPPVVGSVSAHVRLITNMSGVSTKFIPVLFTNNQTSDTSVSAQYDGGTADYYFQYNDNNNNYILQIKPTASLYFPNTSKTFSFSVSGEISYEANTSLTNETYISGNNNAINNITQAVKDSINSMIDSQKDYSTDISNAASSISSATSNAATSIIQQIVNSNSTLASAFQQYIQESQNYCKEDIIDKNYIEDDNVYLLSNGQTSSNNSLGITSYIEINGEIKVLVVQNTNANTCYYTENKQVINCIENNTMVENNNLTIPSNAKYIRVSILKNTNKPQLQMTICQDRTQATLEEVAQLSDRIHDSADDLLNAIEHTDQKIIRINHSFMTDFERQGYYINTSGVITLNSKYNLYKYPLQEDTTYHLKYSNKYDFVNDAAYCTSNVKGEIIQCYSITGNSINFSFESGAVSDNTARYVYISVPNGGDEYDSDYCHIWYDYNTNNSGAVSLYGDLNAYQEGHRWNVLDDIEVEYSDDGNFFQKVWNVLKTMPTSFGSLISLIGSIFNGFNNSGKGLQNSLTDLNSSFQSNNAISSLLLLPVNAIRAFNIGFYDICYDWNLGSLYGHEIQFRCINLESYVGTAIWEFHDHIMIQDSNHSKYHKILY